MKNLDKIFVVKFVTLFLFIIIINNVSASILLGNISHSFDEIYAKNSFLKGWINISLINESSSTLIKTLNKNVTIDELFKKNDIKCNNEKCSCFPSDCSTKYETEEAHSSYSYELGTLSSKLIGIRLTENVTQISEFRFNVSSNAGDSCLPPLVIDLLDDKSYEFKAIGISNYSCNVDNAYGCFNSSVVSGNTIISTNPLCGIFELPPVKGYAVGAKLIGDGNAKFHMTLETNSLQETCNFIISEGGEKFCNIIIDELSTENANATLCIFADRQNTNSYKINFEDVAPCGYVEENGIMYKHDFELFAKPLMYAAPGNFAFNKELLESEDSELNSIINDYINEKYNNCAPECIIPIRFYSGSNQRLYISELKLGYKSQGLEKPPIIEFYDINVSPYIINSDFITLELEKLGFNVPSSVGIKNLSMNIGDKIVNYKIKVENLSVIYRIIPNETTLLVPTLFNIILDNYGNDSYNFNWDFGDGIKLQTDKPFVKHTYTELGVYTLTVNVSNKFGTSSKKFVISVANPYEAINKTLDKYNKRIRNLENNISVFPTWTQEEAKKFSKIEELKSEVKRLDGKYKETFRNEEDELVKIMKELVILNVPIGISNPLSLNNIPFIQDDKLDYKIFQELGAGDIEENKDYYSYIQSWINENMDITLSSETFTIFYENEKKSFSQVTLTLVPKKDIEEFFIFIEGDVSQTKFKEYYDEKETEKGYGLKIKDLVAESSKKIEFIYPKSINLDNFPIYVSPLFKELDIIEPGICDSDKICESSKGENYKNCRTDCKPWKLTFLFFVLLFIIGFIVYIILQEWYKRYYESYLFKDKNQLFNLITFMSISQGMKMEKKVVFDKLKQNWKTEQLEYAWRKLNGMRTGMWEIPIFKLFEKKKIAEEIQKRKVFFGNNPRNVNFPK